MSFRRAPQSGPGVIGLTPGPRRPRSLVYLGGRFNMGILVVFSSGGRLNFEAFDRAYIDRLTQGDPETERHFTSYFSDLLTIKLRSRIRSAQLIEDIKQETFLRVLTLARKPEGLKFPE